VHLFLEVDKQGTACFADGFDAAANAGRVDPLADSTVELAHLEAGGDVPDVVECDLGELAAPLGSDADTAAEGGDLVAETEPEVEAGVREFPHAVDGAGTLGLTKNLLELDLQVIVEIVGISVDKIDFPHVAFFNHHRNEIKRN